MYTFLVQTIVLVRNGDSKGWMEILVLIIMAVVWAIGGIIKAKANKEKEQVSEKPAPKPRPRPFEITKATRKQPGKQFKPSLRKAMRPRPVGPKTPVDFSLEAQPKQDLSQSIPKVQLKIDKLPDLKVSLKQSQIPPDKQPTDILPSLLDIDEPDELRTERLRMAILHYEILGKPVSMRSISESLF